MIETKENIKYQEQESVEFLGEFTKPLFNVGDFLKNKEDGSVIVIIAIVSDQYKYDEGGELSKYEFFECIEAQYDKIRSKDDIARNAASGWCRCFKCDGIIRETHTQCDKKKLATCLQWYHGYRTALLALPKCRKQEEPTLRSYLAVCQRFVCFYPTLEPTLEPTLNPASVFTYLALSPHRSQKIIHKTHDNTFYFWNLFNRKALHPVSVLQSAPSVSR